MTTPMPAAGEPVPAEPVLSESVLSEADVEFSDHRSVRRLWWMTIIVMTLAFLATVAVVAWQWLGPASGTVTR